MRIAPLSLALVLACSRDEKPLLPADASAPADAAAAVADAGAKATRLAFSRALAQGREHAHQKRWSAAIAAFEEALTIQPDDVVVLNELAWAAVNAGDDAKAKRATAHALALHPPPALEAQALYNEGRRLAAAGQIEKARALYQRSLDDRENDTVKKRLESLASDASTGRDAGAPPPSSLPCTHAPGDEAELKRCIEAYASGKGVTTSDAAFFFEPDLRRTLPPNTSLYRFGAKSEARKDTTLLLVAATKRGLVPIALLGSSTGTAEVTSAEKKSPTTWLVRSSLARIDQSLSGLEVREESTDLATACIFSGSEPTCPVQVPVQLRSKLAYPNLVDLDAAEQALVNDRIQEVGPPYDEKTELDVTLTGTALVVTWKSGKKDHIPAGVLGAHPLR